MQKLYLLVVLLAGVLSVHAKDTKIENLTSDEYQKKFEELMRAGLRPVKVTIQPGPGSADRAELPRFGATFAKVKNTPAWQARHGLTTATYAEVFGKLVPEGYIPTEVATACVNNEILYSTIFERLPNPKPLQFLINLFPEEFDQANKELEAQGLKLKWKNTCETPLGPVYAAFWEKE